MRSLCGGGLGSRHVTAQQLRAKPSILKLSRSLLKLVFSMVLLHTPHTDDCRQLRAGFATAAEAPDSPSSVEGSTNSRKNGKAPLTTFQVLQAAHTVLVPIRQHEHLVTTPRLEDRRYQHGTIVDCGEHAIQGQSALLAQDGNDERRRFHRDMARTLGTTVWTSVLHDAETAVSGSNYDMAPKSTTEVSDRPFASPPAAARNDTTETLIFSKVRASCKGYEEKRGVGETNQRAAAPEKGRIHIPTVHGNSVSFAATRNLEGTKGGQQLDSLNQGKLSAPYHSPSSRRTSADDDSEEETEAEGHGQDEAEDNDGKEEAEDTMTTTDRKDARTSTTGHSQDMLHDDNGDDIKKRTQAVDLHDSAEPASVGSVTSGNGPVRARARARHQRRGAQSEGRGGRPSTLPQDAFRRRRRPSAHSSERASASRKNSVQVASSGVEASPRTKPRLQQRPATSAKPKPQGSRGFENGKKPRLSVDGAAPIDAETPTPQVNRKLMLRAEGVQGVSSGKPEQGNVRATGPFSRRRQSERIDNGIASTNPFSPTSIAAADGTDENVNLPRLVNEYDITSVDAGYKVSVSPEASKALQEQRGKRREKQAWRGPTELESIYKKAKHSVPAANYLGAGYDSIKGNPVGDPVLMGDPGLRAPVIRLQYQQDAEGVSNDLTSLQPVGGYVRPYVACRQSETVKEINSLRDYQKELSTDASLQGGDMLGLNCFSASAGYKEVAQEVSSKLKKSYMLKTYCIRFEAGLAQSSNMTWKPTLAFAAAVDQLPVDFDGKKPGCACTPDQWRQDHSVDACKKSNVPLWFSFFDQFGTHYITHLFAGGKMTYQVTVSASDVRKAKRRGVNIEAQLKLQLGISSGGGSTKSKYRNQSNTRSFELNITKETLIIGGRPPRDISNPASLAQWSDTVEHLPMPVKMEFQSLHLLLPSEKQHAFLDAAAFYAKAVGMSLQDLNLLNGEVKSLAVLLTQATQVAWAGPAPGFATCPPGKVVIAGFAAHLNFLHKRLDNYHISACSPGREKCDGLGVSTSPHDDERIYIICGEESLNELQQVVAESLPSMNESGAILRASCPEDTIVVGGFGISVGTQRAGLEAFDIEACKTGQTICTKVPSPNSSKSYIWMMCVDQQFPGARGVTNAVALGAVGKANKSTPNFDGEVTVKCPEDSIIVQGFVMEAHTSLPRVRDRYTHCKAGIDSCTIQGKGVENGGLLKHDRHALFGWCLCSPRDEPAVHVASDSRRKAHIRLQNIMEKQQTASQDAVVPGKDVNLQGSSNPTRARGSRFGGKQRRPPKPASSPTFGPESAPAASSPDAAGPSFY